MGRQGDASRRRLGAASAFSALFILFGWIGVSGTPVVAKQIPYLVSGGIGGIFLAVLGAYFLGTQELRKDTGRLDRLERMVAELHRRCCSRRTDAPDLDRSIRRRRGPSPRAAPTNGQVVRRRSRGSDMFHRAELRDGRVEAEVRDRSPRRRSASAADAVPAVRARRRSTSP